MDISQKGHSELKYFVSIKMIDFLHLLSWTHSQPIDQILLQQAMMLWGNVAIEP